MKTRYLLILAMAICFVSVATAQTKASGTLQCGKPDPMHVVEVGDKPGHSLTVSKLACTWSKPMDIGGSQSKEGTDTEIGEMNGNKSTGNGVHWGTTASGDKYFVRYSGSATYKDGALVSGAGTWKYTGGTGALKGITGKGTYKVMGAADGTSTAEVEGDWSLPAAKAPAAKAPAAKAPAKK
jgi:hypothetical protein